MPRRIQTLCLILTATSVGQQRQPADTPESVFRVTTGLVQADVAVFDRQGRFVDNLQREQFELRVDGAPQAISFFDRVQIGAASGDAPLDGGRTVLFFVDDFHIAYASLKRTRDLLTDFIDNGMGLNDQAAIASSSGQIGFLQQLTSYKAVLRAAVGRLGNRMQQAADMERPSMTAHQADILDKKSDRQLFEYFVKETMRQNPGVPREVADSIVAGRALRMAAESARTTLNTLGALEGLVRSGAELPQRKLVFFISDGFESHLGGSEISNRLERIADSATRSRAAIYTIEPGI